MGKDRADNRFHGLHERKTTVSASNTLPRPLNKKQNFKRQEKMTSEVVIDVQEKEISIALLEDKNLVEYQTEPRSASFSVGNIYVAKVKKLMPGLNASFVDVGFERDAFLHYLDLGNQFNSYEKYLKQVQSDRKKLYPFSKASRLPDLKKDGTVATTLQKSPNNRTFGKKVKRYLFESRGKVVLHR